MAANRSKEFGALMRRIKEENSWSLAEMEEAADHAVGLTYFSTLMQGQVPSRDTLQRILEGTGFRRYAKELWEASGYQIPDEFRTRKPYCDLARTLAEQLGQDKETVILEALERYAAGLKG